MAVQRNMTREDCLHIIKLREETNIGIAEAAKMYYHVSDTVRCSLMAYGLQQKWKDARRVYEKKIALEALELRKDQNFMTEDICKYFDIDKKTLYKYIERAGLKQKFRQALFDREYISKARTGNGNRIPIAWLYQQRVVYGRSYESIAKEFGCSLTKIQNWCTRYNMQKPPKEIAARNRLHAQEMFDKKW